MKRILVTRPREQADGFIDALKAAGFEPICFPVIQIRPMEDHTQLDQALKNLDKYEWIVFTSVNAVEVVFDVIARSEATKQAPNLGRRDKGEGIKVASIGPKTAEALNARGVIPDFVPEEYVAESILPGLGNLNGKWVLLPRAEIARKALPEAIVNAGGIAHEIAVYKTLPAQVDPDGLAALKSGVDWITFTSPSTAQNFVEIVRRQKMNPFELKNNPKVACIGPITEKAAKEEGFKVDLVAEEYTT
ncbi:MAG: uroporphyrinogen-III synthase, partial [Chloroflexi bacterium]|nr:uroporphyrinogen-III synthase [Chloroflexota bacterium]